MAQKQIFKYQESQFPKGVRCLVYNKEKTIMGEFDVDSALVILFNRYGPKFYAVGEHDETTGKVIIDDIVSTQDW